MKLLSGLSILLAGLLTACHSNRSDQPSALSVSIEPLRYLAEQIVGGDFTVNVLVPQGASPETYEPTPAQMRQVANSTLYIHTGLIDFEANLAKAIRENMPGVGIVRLADGVPLIEGDCHHDHDDDAPAKAEDESESEDVHHHGVDPHIWSSPKSLKVMAKTLYEALAERYPDSVKYTANYQRLTHRLDSLDAALEGIFAGKQTHFMIYHPALTYLARDYGLTQISLEADGKEPSADHIRRLIDSARQWQIPHVLYQRQFSRNTVDALSRELNIEAIPIDPLGYDIPQNLLEISRLIANP